MVVQAWCQAVALLLYCMVLININDKIMTKDFYTESQLMTMPLKILRNLDIDNKEQEDIVLKVVTRRLSVLPPSQPIFRKDVPDIQNPEEEAHWQQIINERTAKLRPAPIFAEDSPSEGLQGQAGTVEILNPSDENFDPTKLELANETEEKVVKPTSVQARIAELEKPVMGTPITFTGGVPSHLTQKPRSSRKK